MDKKADKQHKCKMENLIILLDGYKKGTVIFDKLYFSTVESYPKSNFYKGLLQVWFDFISVRPLSLKELLQEPLFNNDTFQIGESHICI